MFDRSMFPSLQFTEWLVYDQDVCIGSVRARTELEAWQIAKAKYRITTDNCPMFLQPL